MLSPVFSDRVIVDNQNYYLSLREEVTGYSPFSGYAVIPAIDALSKSSDETLDICIGFESPLKQGSRAYLNYDNITSFSKIEEYTCNSPDYGWLVQGKIAYCDTPYYDEVNQTNSIKRELVYVSDNFNLKAYPNYAYINWTIISKSSRRLSKEITQSFKVVYKPSPYGAYWYCTENDFVKENLYSYRFRVSTQDKLTDYKYSLAILNSTDNDILLVIDPVITTSRTWADSEDFTNGTILYNISVNSSDIRLSNVYTNQSHSHQDTNQQTDSGRFGHQIVIGNQSVVLKKVIVYGGDTSTIARVYNCNTATTPIQLSTASIVSEVADFNYILNKSTCYVIAVDNGGLTYNNRYDASSTYPKGNTYLYWNRSVSDSWSTPNGWDDGSTVSLSVKGINITVYNFTGTYSDLQEWTPRSGSRLSNMYINAVINSRSNIYFQYNATNASLDTSGLIRLSVNGSNNITLNLSTDEGIFYRFVLNETSGDTPIINSYTLYEENITAPSTITLSDVYTIVLNTNTTLNSLMTEFQYFTIILLYLVLMIFSIWLIRIRSTFLGFGLFALTILFDFWFIYWSSLVFLPNFTALDWQSYFNMIPMTFFPLWIFIKILAIMLSVSRFGIKKIF